MRQPSSHQPGVRYIQSVLVRPLEGNRIWCITFNPDLYTRFYICASKSTSTLCVLSLPQTAHIKRGLAVKWIFTAMSHDPGWQTPSASLSICDKPCDTTAQRVQSILPTAPLHCMQGGKLSVLAAAVDPRVVALCLLDPVDNTVWAPLGPGYPSAIQALKQLGSKQVLFRPASHATQSSRPAAALVCQIDFGAACIQC